MKRPPNWVWPAAAGGGSLLVFALAFALGPMPLRMHALPLALVAMASGGAALFLRSKNLTGLKEAAGAKGVRGAGTGDGSRAAAKKAARRTVPPVLRNWLGWTCATAILMPLRVPWNYPWDALSVWLGVACLPAFLTGLEVFLAAAVLPRRGRQAVLVLGFIALFPVKALFKSVGADLPPTPWASPLALLAAGAMAAWAAGRASSRSA